MDKADLLSRRFYILSNLEKIIETSVYYRNHSMNINEQNKKIIGNVNQKEVKAKIL